MTTAFDVQRALLARGYSIGNSGADGDIGPATLGAMMQALEKIPLTAPLPIVSPAAGVVPADWMPWCKMHGIIVHWNAGTHKASALDRKHYHIIIQDDGSLVRGDMSISDNVSTSDGRYAAHTLNCNAGFIAVMLCGMGGKDVRESPFSAGKWPITKAEWDKLPYVLADLCRRYTINVTPQTVLSHAEVQGTLGIKQKGKWDITRLPFDPSTVGAMAVGDKFRAATRALL